MKERFVLLTGVVALFTATMRHASSAVKPFVLAVFILQVCTHCHLIVHHDTCNPLSDNQTCNTGALFIGVFYVAVNALAMAQHGLDCCTVPAMILSMYVLASHIVKIEPLQMVFHCAGLRLPFLDVNSYVLVASHTFHEPKTRSVIERILQTRPGALIDAGAYVGDLCMPVANRFKESTVYAIEPSDKCLHYIKKLVKINEMHNVTTLSFVLSDHVGIKYQTMKEDNANSKYHAVATSERPSSDHISHKSSTTLDHLVHTNVIKDAISIIHLDLEGMELKALAGCRTIIEKQRPYFVIETLGQTERRNVIEFFTQFNYHPRSIDETCCLGDFMDLKDCRNYLFVP